ncbi:MAG TPA: GNAT family N-acetyltransferase, partial [Stellaceae bacterium]|nr:GNAT family N-acetyltransferase [Stellaceae bacterium]
DGRGGWRVLLALLPEERARDGKPVTLRLAERGDSELMFAWQSMPEVRRYSRCPELPSLAEHVAWVEASLARPDRVLSLILHDGLPVGVLRFDQLDATPIQEISILLDPRLHGRGIAAAALRLGQQLFRGAILHAEVDPANAASRRLFQQAGFQAIDARRFDWSYEPRTAGPTAPASAAAEVIP